MESAGAKVATRIPKSLRDRLEQRAEQAGCKLSPVIAGLLEAVLDLEERLAPFRPAIERTERSPSAMMPASG